MGKTIRWLLATCLLCAGLGASAFDGVVQKQRFTIPAFTTAGGRTLKQVQFGYETYGTLNAKRDNVILVTHYFSGSSHAAGRYQADDKAPGYWDAIIGAGKPLDTDRYFVIAPDALCNLNAKDPRVVTTGPASLDPDTGRPYGLTSRSSPWPTWWPPRRPCWIRWASPSWPP